MSKSGAPCEDPVPGMGAHILYLALGAGMGQQEIDHYSFNIQCCHVCLRAQALQSELGFKSWLSHLLTE